MTVNQIPTEPRYRLCSVCGKSTPAELGACVNCGAGSPEAAVAALEAATEYRFLHAVFSRSNQFTLILIVVNLGVFLLEWLAGGMGPLSADISVLIAFGAKKNALIAEQHQYWRLVTCVFLHIGFVHFLLNNYALWIIGRDIEQIYGSARFLLLYVTTGVVASISSFFFSPNSVSAGASGAIFGLFGVMAAFAFRYRKEIPAALSKDIRRRVLPIIAINLVFGFSARGIVDNAAHIGGLFAGIALALVIPFKHPEAKETSFVWRALQALCIAAVVASFVAAVRNYDGPQLSLANMASSPGSGIVDYYNRMRSAHSSLRDSINSFARALNLENGTTDIDAALRAVEKGIGDANAAPRLESEAEAFRQRLIGLLNQQKTAIDRYRQQGGSFKPEAGSDARKIRESYERFRAEYDPWLETYLQENGYELKRESSK
ncbi:MAG: rhomboid family intramembrane serine protease [Blastocatellia bacterium]